MRNAPVKHVSGSTVLYRLSAGLVVVSLFALILLPSACSSSSGSSIDAGAADAGTADSGTGDAGAATTAVLGAAFELSAARSPIPNLDVCVIDHPEIACAKSDANGNFNLKGLPPKTELMLSVKGGNFLPVLRTVITGDANKTVLIGGLLHPTSTIAQQLLQALGATLTSTQGELIFDAALPPPTGSLETIPIRGASASMTPMSGIGPVYMDPSGLPDPRLHATSFYGRGFYFNVDPGMVEVTLTSTRTCKARDVVAWPTNQPTTVRVPIRAGYLTYGAPVTCNPP